MALSHTRNGSLALALGEDFGKALNNNNNNTPPSPSSSRGTSSAPTTPRGGGGGSQASSTPAHPQTLQGVYDILTPKPPDLLQENRLFIKGGEIHFWKEPTKSRGKVRKARRLLLFSDILLIVKEGRTTLLKERKYALKVFISLQSSLRVGATHERGDYEFTLFTSKRSFVFAALSEEELLEWIHSISQCILLSSVSQISPNTSPSNTVTKENVIQKQMGKEKEWRHSSGGFLTKIREQFDFSSGGGNLQASSTTSSLPDVNKSSSSSPPSSSSSTSSKLIHPPRSKTTAVIVLSSSSHTLPDISALTENEMNERLQKDMKLSANLTFAKPQVAEVPLSVSRVFEQQVAPPALSPTPTPASIPFLSVNSATFGLLSPNASPREGNSSESSVESTPGTTPEGTPRSRAPVPRIGLVRKESLRQLLANRQTMEQLSTTNIIQKQLTQTEEELTRENRELKKEAAKWRMEYANLFKELDVAHRVARKKGHHKNNYKKELILCSKQTLDEFQDTFFEHYPQVKDLKPLENNGQTKDVQQQFARDLPCMLRFNGELPKGANDSEKVFWVLEEIEKGVIGIEESGNHELGNVNLRTLIPELANQTLCITLFEKLLLYYQPKQMMLKQDWLHYLDLNIKPKRDEVTIYAMAVFQLINMEDESFPVMYVKASVEIDVLEREVRFDFSTPVFNSSQLC